VSVGEAEIVGGGSDSKVEESAGVPISGNRRPAIRDQETVLGARKYKDVKERMGYCRGPWVRHLYGMSRP
jgi:hypothetical protein